MDRFRSKGGAPLLARVSVRAARPAGTLHLTSLFLLSTHLTEDNAAGLLGEARGKSRRQIEELIARWFPGPTWLQASS